ncbi:MAG TPA: CocE/NonD family hydrolase, partial [Solirubrobacter sp.]|nr:CocE/NonD family hydrolase [Solirubrobacter sp.]
MTRRAKGLTGALALAALLLGGGVAKAQGPVLENGKTKAVYDYTQAVRERVFIPQPGIDQDNDGNDDYVTADIIRPKEASAANKMPAIIDPSPYYTTLCRGNESQCMADWDNDGVNDRWPLYYDNYFVPRGYAYILGQMNGTGYTEQGCPMHGGPGDIAGEKSIIDWLNGRVKAYAQLAPSVAGDTTTPDLTKEVVADWHNGSSAMIGKSYDGTLANGVAATGVEGLKTIVPISAISSWYNYSRTGGVRHNTNYPGGSLNPTVTTGPSPPVGVTLPNRRAQGGNPGPCGDENSALNNDDNVDTGDGDTHGDVNTFWRDRDYVKDVSKVKAAVFITHGFQDSNVRMDHVSMWWKGLEANNVPRKLWLLRAGHEDPFESRREVWVDTLHRWFDHWLYGVNNGIENEPNVTVEEERDVWADYTAWPINGTEFVDLYLRAVDNPASAGTLGGSSGGALDSLNFNATFASENTLMNNPTGSQANRRVFMTKPLAKDVRLSGEALADLTASFTSASGPCVVARVVADTTYNNCPNLSVVIVDYGAGTQVSTTDEGVANLTTRRCWGDGAPGNVCEGKQIGDSCTLPSSDNDPLRRIENACYLDVTKPITNVTQWRVTRGIRDTQNRDSLWFGDVKPVTINEPYRVQFPTLPTEHTFKAGHQIGVIVGGTNTSQASGPNQPNNVPTTLDTRVSKVSLPIVGGYKAAVEAGITDAETVAPVFGDAPDVTAHTADPTGTTVTFTNPSATDNEDPNPVVTCDPPSGSKFPVGSTVVTCTARDANGNTAQTTFNVIVGFDSTVSGNVPATLSLTLGPAATFSPFTPGVGATYETSTTANVISSAGDATLSVADPSPVATGHLVNGTYSLPQPLQARARNATNTGIPYNNVGSSAEPLNLLMYDGPISNDQVELGFSQRINATDALRTGTYSKTLTFTLS